MQHTVITLPLFVLVAPLFHGPPGALRPASVGEKLLFYCHNLCDVLIFILITFLFLAEQVVFQELWIIGKLFGTEPVVLWSWMTWLGLEKFLLNSSWRRAFKWGAAVMITIQCEATRTGTRRTWMWGTASGRCCVQSVPAHGRLLTAF